MLRFAFRGFLASLFFFVAFVVNPAFIAGCIGSGDEDDADTAKIEAELVERLDAFNGIGAFRFSEDGESYELLIELTRATQDDVTALLRRTTPLTSVAHACGTTTFYQSASACATRYELAVKGTLTVRRLGDMEQTIASDVALTGSLDHYGVELSFGDGSLSFGSSSTEGVHMLSHVEAHDLGDEKLDLSHAP